ncbi:MAG: ABC transporter substrate-binding protein [Lachnospiraceae bacterium]|nr:ABC transporter substrate-binding protein [Lachnospiraceae bacterium]
MKRKISALFVLILIPCLLLSSCAGANSDVVQKTVSGGNTITVLNYGEYIDRSVLEDFYKETGINVLYEEATTPEEMYAKYMGGAINYDLICTSDYMAAKLCNEGELLPLDFSKFQYIDNIDPRYMEMTAGFDPGNLYFLPYFWGTVGILYNASMVHGEVDSWEVLFNGEYSGDIIMQNSIRDAYMCALKYLGYSLNTTDRNELLEAQELLLNQKKDVEAYFVDEVREEMVAGNAAIAVIYSGEAYLANEYDPNLEYVVPKEGTNLWIDVWCMTKRCASPDNARKFLDYLCREDIALRNFEEIYYPTVNKAIYDELEPEILEDEMIFPNDEVIDNSEVNIPLDNDTTEFLGNLWKELKVY